jgi:cytochrome c peroxidase
MRFLHLPTALALSLCVPWFGFAEPGDPPPDAAVVRALWSAYMKPLPATALDRDADPKVVDLGRRLFYERALSPDHTRSCNDCHDLSTYGANGAVASEARASETLKRDVPSLYNLGKLTLLCWDGGESNLRAQTAAALISPDEIGNADEEALVNRLQSMPAYVDRFKDAFVGDRGGLSFENIVAALTVFQEGLVTRAPFDDFLLGDDKALTPDQLKGAVLFDAKNCSACHTGTMIGGQMLQKAGIAVPWPNQEDPGHFDVTGDAAHKMAFRVPPLRNVAETGPYFHDYSARSLRRAIYDIALREQGMHLMLEDILLLESFLESLTGQVPVDYIKAPSAD